MLTAINRFINNRIRHVYIMAPSNPRYFYRAKIGISSSPKRRKKEVQDSIEHQTGHRVTIGCISAPFLLWGLAERKMLNLTAWMYLKADMPGSGRTEWRWYLNIFTGLILSLLCGLSGNGKVWMFFCIMFLPVPLDFILLFGLFWLLEWLVVFGGLWLLYFIFSHLNF